MSLLGLPDFGATFTAHGYRPFESPGPIIVLPTGLSLRSAGDGSKVFRLQRFRGTSPTRPPLPYSLLTLGLAAEVALSDALLDVRALDPVGRVAPATLTEGFLRIGIMPGSEQENEESIAEPTPISWDGLANTLWTTRLTLERAGRLQAAMLSGFLPISAVAELEIRGVAPRVPVRAVLDNTGFAAAVADLTDQQGTLTRTRLIGWLRDVAIPGAGSPGALLRSLDGEATGDVLAQVLADWIRARHGVAAPSASGSAEGRLRIRPPVEPGFVTWNLAEPQLTWRPVRMELPLHAAVPDFAQQVSHYLPPGVTVPAIDLGWLNIDVLANLPEALVGVVACGVNVVAEPHPPNRPQAVTGSCEFVPGKNDGRITLRLSAGEEPAYLAQTWAVVQDETGVHELLGAQTPRTGPQLFLRPADFAARFLPMAASRALLELADVDIAISVENRILARLTLTADVPEGALVLPSGSEDAVIDVHCRARSGGAAIGLGPFAVEPISLDLHHFGEWGPHEVAVSANPGPEGAVLLELRAQTPQDATVAELLLTEDQPQRRWRYTATDPFRSGYFYRISTTRSDEPWTGPLPFTEPLNLGVPA